MALGHTWLRRSIFHQHTVICYFMNLGRPNSINFKNVSTLTENEMVTPVGGQRLLSVFEDSPKRFQRIKFLANLYQTNGYELRIAGGAVRDIVSGLKPHDIDFATTATPDESLKILKDYEDLLRIIVTAAGLRHGTVAVKFKEGNLDFKRIKLHSESDNCNEPHAAPHEVPKNKPEYDEESPYEITTLRSDDHTDGRHAQVNFIKDWRIDAERRDLTINAMFLTLDDGRLIDYYNGESDLKNGVVRFVGDPEKRLKEDYLRILRFFRFWSRYGKNRPDSETLSTIRENLSGLDIISGERIWVEVKKILSHLPTLEVIKLMLELRVFEKFGLLDLHNDEALIGEIKLVEKNIEDYLQRDIVSQLTKGESDPFTKKVKDLLPVILFATLVSSSKAVTNVHQRLKLSNLERDSILYIVENRSNIISLKSIKHQLAIARAPDRPLVMNKLRALLIYSGKFELIDEMQNWQVPNFPLSGHIISQAVRKYKLPRDAIGTIQESLKDEWVESDYKSSVEDLNQSLMSKLKELHSSLNKT